ncbi:MAG TPA: hypothetical protein VGW75_09775 [Solirubrobacteraceae bacterium]|jgi:hypothetical protein|nr:hypothetical protein [Solirubrobacteraceae bacterium]
MDPARIVSELAAIGGRGPCTDAERRAARALARHLRASGRRARTETLWVRPQWPAIWLAHALLGIAGSVVSVDHPVVGLAVAGVAALSGLGELTGRVRTIALLWPRRATQNVVAAPPDERAPVRLIVTAPYDAARSATGAARALGRVDARLRRALGGRWPSPLGLLALSLLTIAACAGARVAGVEATWLGAVQLLPTVVCIVATALLADLALAEPTRGANANASAAAVALALVAALDERPPRRLDVELVLAGAGAGPALGMRGYVRSRRRALAAERVAVLAIEPCAGGEPRFWTHDGPVLGTRLHPQLARLAAAARGRPHRGRGVTGALRARQAGWPALAVGCVDGDGRVPRAGGRDDTAANADAEALGAALDLALRVVRKLDADVG